MSASAWMMMEVEASAEGPPPLTSVIVENFSSLAVSPRPRRSGGGGRRKSTDPPHTRHHRTPNKKLTSSHNNPPLTPHNNLNLNPQPQHGPSPNNGQGQGEDYSLFVAPTFPIHRATAPPVVLEKRGLVDFFQVFVYRVSIK